MAVEERAAPLALAVAEELEVAVAVEVRAAAEAEEDALSVGNKAPKGSTHENMKDSNRSPRIAAAIVAEKGPGALPPASKSPLS